MPYGPRTRLIRGIYTIHWEQYNTCYLLKSRSKRVVAILSKNQICGMVQLIQSMSYKNFTGYHPFQLYTFTSSLRSFSKWIALYIIFPVNFNISSIIDLRFLWNDSSSFNLRFTKSVCCCKRYLGSYSYLMQWDQLINLCQVAVLYFVPGIKGLEGVIERLSHQIILKNNLHCLVSDQVHRKEGVGWNFARGFAMFFDDIQAGGRHRCSAQLISTKCFVIKD